MLSVFMVILHYLPVAVEGPPVSTCFVQTELFRSTTKTPCGGELQKISNLIGQQVSADKAFGTQNVADLVLSRGGIFDYEQQNLENIHVCALHRNQLGTGWTEIPSNRPNKRAGTRTAERCNIPTIAGFKDHTTTVFSHPSSYVAKAYAAAVMNQKSVLIPLGTGKFVW